MLLTWCLPCGWSQVSLGAQSPEALTGLDIYRGSLTGLAVEAVSSALSWSWQLEHLHLMSSSELLLTAWWSQIGCTFSWDQLPRDRKLKFPGQLRVTHGSNTRSLAPHSIGQSNKRACPDSKEWGSRLWLQTHVRWEIVLWPSWELPIHFSYTVICIINWTCVLYTNHMQKVAKMSLQLQRALLKIDSVSRLPQESHNQYS